ncbi:MAG: ROK family protein [Planctomycetaceae bacterium]|nr:ROK family protein [Planctomycetaceae bacterium]
MTRFLGIEIGGTKLQLGLGRGDGVISALWRGTVDRAEGGEGIRKQIVAAVPELLAKANLDRGHLRGVGIGFGGPTDDKSQTVIKSHHVAGWDGFPLADWISDLVGVPAVVCNDADVAGLGEALFGAGKGMSPIFYITVGTGIGGGLIIDGEIYRGVGKGAAEIGHLLVYDRYRDQRLVILEETSAGWGIEATALHLREAGHWCMGLEAGPITVKQLAEAARAGNAEVRGLLDAAVQNLAFGIRQMITLLCPRRVIIGGGVSLIGEELFFEPIRRYQSERGMGAFAGLTDIVPAALGEEVVIHGALALARKKLGG